MALPGGRDSPIRVLLAAHQPFVRRSLSVILSREADITVVAEAADAATAIELCQQFEPGVAILGQTLPADGADGGLATARRIRALGLLVPILLTPFIGPDEESGYLLETLRAGASGYVHVEGAAEALPAAVRTVHSGEVVLYPSGVQLLLRHYLDDAKPPPGLSSDELAVLQQTVAGASVVEIARRLSRGPSQVREQQQEILVKLGLTHRAALVRYASERGLL